MTKNNLIVSLIIALVAVFGIPQVAYASEDQATETGVIIDVPVLVDNLVQAQIDSTPIDKTEVSAAQWSCKNVLASRLYKGGFRDEALHRAWAIAMRESGGNPKSISSTGDYGIFQFNFAAWHHADWWITPKMLDAKYNVEIAFQLSLGGRTFYPWDINGDGTHKGRYTSNATYQKYVEWYNKYPCK